MHIQNWKATPHPSCKPPLTPFAHLRAKPRRGVLTLASTVLTHICVITHFHFVVGSPSLIMSESKEISAKKTSRGPWFASREGHCFFLIYRNLPSKRP